MESLDNILSGRGEAVSEQPATTEENVTQAAPEAEGQTEQQTDAEGHEDQQQGQKTVPHEALHAEKQKVKRYTEEVSSLRQEIADRDAAWERRIAQLLEAQRPKPETQVPDQFEDFQGATRHAIMPEIDSIRSDYGNAIRGMALRLAEKDAGGKEKLQEIFVAIDRAATNGSIDPATYQAICRSPEAPIMALNYYESELSKIDPDAYEARVLERALAKRGLTVDQLSQQNGQQQQTRSAPVLPTDLAGARNVGARSGPAWSGPTPLADIFAR